MTFEPCMHILSCFPNVNAVFALIITQFTRNSVSNVVPTAAYSIINILGREAVFVKTFVAAKGVGFDEASL